MTPTHEQIEAAIRAEAEKQHLDAELLLRQCEAESSFRADACNAKSGCYGLFQLESATAKWLGVDRTDWQQNIRGGANYMARLKAKYSGDYAKALAAFNFGPGNLDHCIAKHQADWRAHIPAETANYLTKILG